MKTIVFIGTQKSGSSREAVRAAEELGYYTVLLTDKASYLEKRTEFPDVHLMQLCDLNNIEEIKNIIRQLMMKALDIAAIVSFVDPHCKTAAMVSEEFGLNHFTTDGISKMLNKIDSRQVLSDTTYVPRFATLFDKSTLSKSEAKDYLPMIMKSPSSTGSKDVFKINSMEEYSRYLDKLLDRYPEEQILVEEFLDGPQYLVETLINKGELKIVAVLKQEITFDKRFIITGYELLIDLDDSFYNKLKKAVEDIISRHGLVHGACHLEMRLVKDQWKLIEVNPRISGGGMNNIIKAGLGINLVKETIKILVGKEPNLTPKYKKYVFAQYVIVSEAGILEKIIGRNKALKSKGVKEVFIKPRKGALLVPPLSMGNRYAYVIATGKTGEKAKRNAKLAASQIRFKLKTSSKKAENQTNTVENQINKVEKQPNIISVPENLGKPKCAKNIICRDKAAAKSFVLMVNKYLNNYINYFAEEWHIVIDKKDMFKLNVIDTSVNNHE